MNRVWKSFLAVCLCFTPVAIFAQNVDVKKHLPEQLGAYHVAEWLDYEGEALYDYINGGAELYLSYGLKTMVGCKYEGDGLPEITVEIYEMTTSENAYGVYTQSRDKEEDDFGQGSQSYGDFILFWKDRYYVIVRAMKATDESTATLRRIAATIDGAITQTGQKPAIIADLPQKNLVPAGFLYFHHYVWLNAYLFIADYNIVNISDSTDAVLAKYGDADARCYLLIVDYNTAEDAQKAHNQLKEKFAPESDAQRPTIQIEDGTWFTTWTKGDHLYAIFNGATQQQTEDLFHSINN